MIVNEGMNSVKGFTKMLKWVEVCSSLIHYVDDKGRGIFGVDDRYRWCIYKED
jgi:hypothetical protein